MPYMDEADLESVPYCNTSDQLLLAEELQSKLLWEGNGWHPDKCRCDEITCVQYLYESFTDSLERTDKCARYKV
jgi:hypothetical protein